MPQNELWAMYLRRNPLLEQDGSLSALGAKKLFEKTYSVAFKEGYASALAEMRERASLPPELMDIFGGKKTRS